MSAVGENEDWFNKIPTMDFSDPSIQHNIIIIVEEEKFYVTSEYLSIHPEFFNTLFNGEFAEKNKLEIEIKEVTAEAFRNFLLVIYPVRMLITKENYEMLLDLSVRFLAVNVLDNVRLFVMDNFDTLDKFDLLEIAIKHNLKDIKEKLRAYFGAHQRKLGMQILCEKGHHTCGQCNTCESSSLNNWSARNGNVLNDYSILKIHKDRILKLSTEAQNFIFQSVLNNL